MPNIKSKLFLINTITNLHVGSGTEATGAIDNRVQRDPITKIPVIHGSGLKGAIREHAKAEEPSYDWTDIFGNEAKKNKEDERKQGNINFFVSDLLFLPVRSDKRPYYMATSPNAVKEFLNRISFHNVKLDEKVNGALKAIANLGNTQNLCEEEGAILEDEPAETLDVGDLPELKKLFGIKEKLAILTETNFKTLCENLPVIARNHLENGESQNLWYEEVVPRQSIFYTFLSYRDEGLFNKLNGILTASPIQIGANATIGYGLCEFKQIGG